MNSLAKIVMIALQRAWFRFDLGMDHFIMIFFWPRGGGGGGGGGLGQFPK